MDAWFAGYTPDLVTVTWVGFDQMRSLGSGESGGVTATPIWADYMEQALKNVPVRQIQPPPGVSALWISSETGRLTTPEDAAGRYEYFRSDMPPPAATGENPSTPFQARRPFDRRNCAICFDRPGQSTSI